METKQYDKMNPETQYLIDKYISGENTTSLEDLEKRGDIFYKKIEVVDQTGLADKVKELAKGDAKKEKDLLLAINTFWETMPSGPKHIEIDGTRDAMTFKTYDQTSTINLSKKELVGFTPSRFDSYYEAFKAANLTNRIQDICKDKLAMKKDPFYSVP
ncbi:TPA: hypothetical protein DCZ39_08455 [Patescibacteria group bacterium]|nr:hypothetical protein [Candidatus Gracilibacteria bacterium]